VSYQRVKILLAGSVLLLCSCGPKLVFNSSQDMSRDEMLRRATLVFIGIIEYHQFDSWPYFHLSSPGMDPERAKLWKNPAAQSAR
jgi:hypothetical protein